MTRLTVEDVYDHVKGVCFKTGPRGKVGAEIEWLVADSTDPTAHVALDRLRTLMDAAGPLPFDSRVTYEPGGQLELSSAAFPGLPLLHKALAADLASVRERLAAAGLTLVGRGIDSLRPPLMQQSEPRYQCMKSYFGPAGLAPMCTTASIQVCLDIGVDHAEVVNRWRLAHALGPVLTAAFANSPVQAGRRTGLRSTRQAIWSDLDPCRTAVPPGSDPVTAWTRYALDARVMIMREPTGEWVADPGMTFQEWINGAGPGRRPTTEDLTYHLSTLFPPVRPRGWLELRMIDALPDPYWPVPIAVVTALFDDPRAADAAAEAAQPVAGRWWEAARDALTDRPLATAARRCFAAAIEALPRMGAAEFVPLVGEYAERYVDRGRCPADDRGRKVPSQRSRRRISRGAASSATR